MHYEIRKLLAEAQAALAQGDHTLPPLEMPDWENLPTKDLVIEFRSYVKELEKRRALGLTSDGEPLSSYGKAKTKGDFLAFRDKIGREFCPDWDERNKPYRPNVVPFPYHRLT